jgi:hypothetical protein
LSDDDLVFILNQAKPEEWQAVILGANIELYQFDFQGTVDYFEKLEVMQALEAKRRKNERTENSGSNKNQSNRNKDKIETSKLQSKYKKCTHCGRNNHATKDCWFCPENENKGNTKPGKKPTDKTVVMTTEQLNTILSKLLPKNPKSGTHKVQYFSPVQSDTEDVKMCGPKTKLSKVDTNHYSDEDSIYLDFLTKHKLSFHYDENNPKRQKLYHKTTEVVGKVYGTDTNGILRILLDTGASATKILKDSIQGLNGPILKEQPTTWNTVGGQFVSNLQR